MKRRTVLSAQASTVTAPVLDAGLPSGASWVYPMLAFMALALAPLASAQNLGKPMPPLVEPVTTIAVPGAGPRAGAVVFDVMTYGAKGDGKTLDTRAINAAIDAAAGAGGGTVYFRAGTYPSFSIHLKSNVALYFDQGSTLLAAQPANGQGYDGAEPGAKTSFQDFGHSHWHNSLMWGENVENVSILGPGLIWGKGLESNPGPNSPAGTGNKTLALKLARNVTIRDVSFFHAGHFAILATGVDNLTIDNVKIDTNRDGIDIDVCRNVRVANVSVNAPGDDAIVLKASYALDSLRSTENVTITNSLVSGGFAEGTLLNGTFVRLDTAVHVRGMGRLKLGTESNGDFKDITISNIIFDYSWGLALETVDGSHLEHVTISNLVMRDIIGGPFFLRLGARMRGPKDMQPGSLKQVNISDVVVYGSAQYASIISGIPGHPIEGITFNNVQIYATGGAPKSQATVTPGEAERLYPEPDMFGPIPAYGFYVRHVNGIAFNNVEIHYLTEDQRPVFSLDDVHGADFLRLKAQTAPGVPTFVLKNVGDFNISHSRPLADRYVQKTTFVKF